MLTPLEFEQKMKKMKKYIDEELLFYFKPSIQQQLLTDISIDITKLCSNDIASDFKGRTILLLKIYTDWHAIKQQVDNQLLFNLADYLSSFFQIEFNLPDTTLFFEITDSIIQNDFERHFYFSIPFRNLYEIAFDLLSFSLNHPPSNILYQNQHSKFYIDIKNNYETRQVYLEFISKDKNYFFSKINILLNTEIKESDVILYSFNNNDNSFTEMNFTNKKTLLLKYLRPLIIEIMFNMENNREFWGVKNFFIQKKFLENLLSMNKE